MKIAVYGAGGRMGKTLVRLIAEAPDLSLVGAIDHSSEALGRDAGELAGAGNLGVVVAADVGAGLLGAEVVIDFSLAGAFDRMLRAAVKAKVPVVSGTTRLSAASEALLDEAATQIPVLWAPNMSLGLQVLARMVEEAVRALGDYDVEIVETHHNQKADAPSGTAVFLQEAAQRARAALRPVHGREGQVGARRPDEIGMHALRGGGVVGDHSVHLLGPFDRIEITHRAMSRELFAAGALAAARFVAGRPPGRYTLANVIS